MKDQYFGDEYDFIKYMLIRRLTQGAGIKTFVNWMLTEPDGTMHGNKVNYLCKPEPNWWTQRDKELFDCLHSAVCGEKIRDTRIIECSDLLGDTRFYPERPKICRPERPLGQPFPCGDGSEYLIDTRANRERHFCKFLKQAESYGLVFFDPDNGLEVNTYGYGNAGSHKYLYLCEVRATYEAGYSLLVFQYKALATNNVLFPKCVARKLASATNASEVYVFRYGQVAFGLVPNGQSRAALIERAKQIAGEDWEGKLEVHAFGPAELAALRANGCDPKAGPEGCCLIGRRLLKDYPIPPDFLA